MRRIVILPLLLLAACGGSSSSDQTAKFKTSFNSVGNQMQRTSQSIGATVQKATGQTDAQLASEFHAYATNWQKALSSLQTLKPPDSVAKPFNTMTGAAGRVESDLNSVTTAATTHNKNAAEQAAGNMVTDIVATKNAAAAIDKQLGIK